MAAKPHLLATAPSLEGIKVCVGKFFIGTAFDLVPVGGAIWVVCLKPDGRVIEHVRVIKKGKRYRFEWVDSCET